jgi:hypothetical protein
MTHLIESAEKRCAAWDATIVQVACIVTWQKNWMHCWLLFDVVTEQLKCTQHPVVRVTGELGCRIFLKNDL